MRAVLERRISCHTASHGQHNEQSRSYNGYYRNTSTFRAASHLSAVCACPSLSLSLSLSLQMTILLAFYADRKANIKQRGWLLPSTYMYIERPCGHQ